MQVHAKGMVNHLLAAQQAQINTSARAQTTARAGLPAESIEVKPGLGLGRGLGEAKRIDRAAAGDSQSQAPEITVQGFHEHWGQSDSPYDLNGDGTVNIDDLLQYINSLVGPDDEPQGTASNAIDAGDVEPAAPVEPIATAIPDDLLPTDPNAPTPEPQPPTIQGFHEYWNQSNAQYDLNQDGTVNIDDLLQFINSLVCVQCPEPTGIPDDHKSQPSAGLTATSSTDAASIAAAATDLDAEPASIEQPTPPSQVSLGGPRDTALASAPSLTNVQKLVQTLISRLDENGFKDHPPTNIRELVSRLDLQPAQTDTVLRHLGEHYPQGLGVNVRA
jgi:hypothetical protein